MAIFRVTKTEDLKVGNGGRITIPQNVREEMRLVDGDALKLRVEKGAGRCQITIWKNDSRSSEYSG
ncbi:MAG: AbrB/MazE/SpoVT family DNA-binding domain-containing protein [Gemmatimonadetes bacterium]|nr:AbrB/MazE/SpoVT family DNA-binding domain-containing protein [Gemmatimonadota bacterium]